MPKGFFCLVLLCLSARLTAQPDFFVLRKGDRTRTIYSTGSYLAFQLDTKAWIAGTITRIANDSFYLRPLEVRYLPTGIDTVLTENVPFTLQDIYAMPKKGVLIDYQQGRFDISMTGGHQHWYWVKSGWIFRVLGLGYLVLDAGNGLIQHDYNFGAARYGTAAGVFLFGEVLRRTYKLTYRLGGKYRMEYQKIPVKR